VSSALRTPPSPLPTWDAQPSLTTFLAGIWLVKDQEPQVA
jgi:hypothetical protein